MSADTILVAIGDMAAGVAAVAAVVGLRFARQTVREGEAGRVEAEAARIDAQKAAQEAADDRRSAAREAAEDRREGERVRQWRRMERVGEIVEDLFWSATREQQLVGTSVDMKDRNWMGHRNRLGHAMVGMPEEWLPNCTALLNDATASQAMGHASLGRQEVRIFLQRLRQQETAYPVRNPR
jgi:hypothetical protein